MRSFRTIAGIVSAMLLIMSCGGGGGNGPKVESNSILGEVPGIYKSVAQYRLEQIEKSKTAEKSEDIMAAKEEAERYESEMMDKVPAAIAGIAGRSVPFTGESDKDFKVESITIAAPESDKDQTVCMRIKVSATREMPVWQYEMDCANGARALQDTRLYLVYIDSKDKFIDLGSINPFSNKAPESKFTPKKTEGETFAAGEMLTDEGSPVYVRCNQFDFSDFAKVVFVPEADYMNMRRQAYGF